MYEYAESEMREVTDGLLGAEVALGVIFGVVIPVDHHLCRHAGH